MNTYQIRNIGLAVALALVAALLTTFYVTNYKKSVEAGQKSVPVAVAARDIPAGSSGTDLVADEVLTTRSVPRRSVVDGAISEPGQVKKLVATETIYKGEQVSVRRFRPMNQSGVHAKLQGNVLALNVPGTSNQLLAGTLREGDRVDVVATWKYPDESSSVYVSRVILRDLLVLRAPKATPASSKLANGPNGATDTAMLAITDTQSKRLFWAMENGEWSLALRAPRKATDGPEAAEGPVSMLTDGIGRNRANAQISGGRNNR